MATIWEVCVERYSGDLREIKYVLYRVAKSKDDDPVQGFAHSDQFESPVWKPPVDLRLRAKVSIGTWDLAETSAGALVFNQGSGGRGKSTKLVVSVTRPSVGCAS